MSIRRPAVLIVAEHDIVRSGLLRILTGMPELRSLDAAADLRTAARLLHYGRHEILLCEFSIAQGPGTALHVLEGFGAQSRVLWLCPRGTEQQMADGPLPGVAGWLVDTASAEEVRAAVRTVIRGDRYICETVGSALAGRATPSTSAGLSERERAVLGMIGQGFRVAQIARHMQVSVTTINTYKQRIRSKTGLRSLAEMVRFAVEQRFPDK